MDRGNNKLQLLYNRTGEIAGGLYSNSPKAYCQFEEYVKELQEFINPLIQRNDDIMNLTIQIANGIMDAYKQQNVLRLADLMSAELSELIKYAAAEQGVKLKIDKEHLQDNKEQVNREHHMVDRSFYKKNLGCVRECKTALYKYFGDVDQKIDENDPTILMDATGNIAVKKQENWWYVNSVNDSEYAARQWIDNLDGVKYNNMIVLFGMSNCDYIREIIKRIEKDNAIVIYEPDMRIFAMNMLYTDMSDILTNDNCFLLVNGLNMHKLDDCLASLLNANTLKYTMFFASPGYDVAWQDELNEFMRKCKISFENIQLLNNTIILKNEKVNHNVIMNLKFVMNGSTIDDLRVQFEKNNVLDVPAIIVASGPSLDKNISDLKEAKNKAFIIATDSALRMLMKYEIMPDIIVTLDPDKERILFSDDRVNDIPMLYSVHATYDILDKNRSKKFIYSNMKFIDTLMTRMDRQISIIDPGGSVANAGFAAARSLGFKKIILIGQDLAFTGNKKHASVVYKEKEYKGEDGPGITTIEGQDGTMLNTYINLKNYRDWFENIIEFNPQLHVINATEGGALIHGADHIRLIDAIEKYCNKEVSFENIIAQTKDTFSEKEKETFEKVVSEYQKECIRLSNITRECNDKYDKLAECKNDKQVRKLNAEIDELIHQMEQSSIMEFISYYARDVENKATTDLYDTEEEQEHMVWKEIAKRGKMVLNSYDTYAEKTRKLFEDSLEQIRLSR